jgi:hypothetical protein
MPLVGYLACLTQPCQTSILNMTVSSIPKVINSYGEDNNSTLYGLIIDGDGKNVPFFYSIPDNHLPYSKSSSIGKINTVQYLSKKSPIVEASHLDRQSQLYDGVKRRMWSTTLNEWRHDNQKEEFIPNYVSTTLYYYLQELDVSLKNVPVFNTDGAISSKYLDHTCATKVHNTIDDTLCSLLDYAIMDLNITRGTVRFYPRAGQLKLENVVLSFDSNVKAVIPSKTNGCPDKIEFKYSMLEPVHIIVTNLQNTISNIPFEIRALGCFPNEAETIYVSKMDPFQQISKTLSGCSNQRVEVWSNSSITNNAVLCKANSDSQSRSASPFTISSTPDKLTEYIYNIQDPLQDIIIENLQIMAAPFDKFQNDIDKVTKYIYSARTQQSKLQLLADIQASLDFYDEIEIDIEKNIRSKSSDSLNSQLASIDDRQKSFGESFDIDFEISAFLIQVVQSITSSGLLYVQNAKQLQTQIEESIQRAQNSIPTIEPYAYMFANVTEDFKFDNSNMTQYIELITSKNCAVINLPKPDRHGNAPCTVSFFDITTWFCNITGEWYGAKILIIYLIILAIIIFIMILIPLTMKMDCSRKSSCMRSVCLSIPLCNAACCLGLYRALCRCSSPKTK